MMRFWDPDRGDIALQGNRLNQFRLDDLRSRMALVAQDTYLFNNTIRENIRLGHQNATDQEVEEAARQANAADFIDSFPDGYDTEVGERGMQLSGGQRQGSPSPAPSSRTHHSSFSMKPHPTSTP